jgi:hypothetical protein
VEFFLAPAELMLAPMASLCGVLEPSDPWLPLSRSRAEDEELAVAQERESAWRSFTCCCRAAGGGVIHRRGAAALRRPGRKGWGAGGWRPGAQAAVGAPRGQESGALLREGRRRDGLRRGWATRGGVVKVHLGP